MPYTGQSPLTPVTSQEAGRKGGSSALFENGSRGNSQGCQVGNGGNGDGSESDGM